MARRSSDLSCQRKGILTTVVVFPRMWISVLSDRGEIYCIIFNMHHLWFVGYHIVDYFHIVPLDLDFNTLGNTFPMIFWVLESNIIYTLIIITFSNTLWYSMWFDPSIISVVCCSIIWQWGEYAFWVTRSNVLIHMLSESVFLLL